MIVAPVGKAVPFAVLEMLTSVAPATTDAVVVDVLFAVVESVGLAMLAVFVMVPVAPLVVFTTSWNVDEAAAGSAAMLHVIVPVPPAAGDVHVNAGPPVCVEETNVVCTGTASVSATLAASAGPLFVTVIVYVTLDPDVAPVGPVFTTLTSAAAVAVAVAVDELFKPLGSGVVVDRLAVFEMVLPFTADDATRITNENVDGTFGDSDAIVHVIVPVPPAAGVVHAKLGPSV